MQKKIPVIFDTDPGIDDSVALAMALFSEELDVKLITTVAGNVGIDNVTSNTLKLLEFFGRTTPVARGAAAPLKRKLEDASWVHGAFGLGEYEFPELKSQAIDKNAVEAIHDILKNSEEKISIIATGPLTNIAAFILTYPKLKNKIEKIVFMGGSLDGVGNKTPYAEFNIGVDPEAADIVFKSGLELVMCPMEMGHSAYFNKRDIARIKVTNYVGAMFEVLFRTYKDNHVKNGAATHDSCTASYLIEPKIFKTKRAYVTVEIIDTVKTGIVVCDFSKKSRNIFNMSVCTRINVIKFKKLFFTIMGNID